MLIDEFSTCEFCPSPALYSCKASTFDFALRPISTLKAGDLIRHPHMALYPRTGHVISVEEFGTAFLDVRAMIARRENGKHNILASFTWHKSGSLWILGPAQCQVTFCERCGCERWDDVHYCQRHWRLAA